jgi:uncharacterized Fe-S cluster protein YjdI
MLQNSRILYLTLNSRRMEPIKEYSNDEITIVWKPERCIHSTVCWKGAEGLLSVFNPRERPWIKPRGATTQRIIDQVERCPSGALSWHRRDAAAAGTATAEEIVEHIVEMVPNGPLMVYGNIRVKDSAGTETVKNKVTAFCRCGASSNKPYCDGSHVKIEFRG